MTSWILAKAALAALLSMIVAGAAVAQAPAREAPAAPAVVSPADAPNAVEDAAITAKIKASLVADQATRTHKIDVDTKGGIVTLDGTVSSGAEALRAVQIARATEGVRSVTNNLRLH